MIENTWYKFTALIIVSFMHHIAEAEDVRWRDSDCNKCILGECAVDREECTCTDLLSNSLRIHYNQFHGDIQGVLSVQENVHPITDSIVTPV